jgi:putative heme iron utilization protein
MTERSEALRPLDEKARAQAVRLTRTARYGALATRSADENWPQASRVALATLIDGAPVFLTSRLASHDAALEADPRCALLIGEPGRGDPLAHPRLTLYARASRLPREADGEARRRYLARHPKAGLYAEFGDFSFWRAEPECADFNAGFGQAYALDGAALRPRADWRALAEVEAEAAQSLNRDNPEAVAHFAAICGARSGRWAVTGIDPEGADLVSGDEVRRLDFMTPVRDAAALRAALVALSRRAV